MNTTTTRIYALARRGVSIWLDTLSRELVEDGGLAELMTELGVSGATSNPTIFAKAITASDRYDPQLRDELATGLSAPEELFLALALEDVRGAAAVLRPLHDASGGRDGFVSLEVAPDVAYDADATVAQAVGLWERLAAPNVMIKVPATGPGIAAIEDLTALGVSVNVTLLFAVERYEQAIEAYLVVSSAAFAQAGRSRESPRWRRSSYRASTRSPTPGLASTRLCAAGSA